MKDKDGSNVGVWRCSWSGDERVRGSGTKATDEAMQDELQ